MIAAREPGTFTCPLVRDLIGGPDNLREAFVELIHPKTTTTACVLITLREDQTGDKLANVLDYVGRRA